MGHLFNHLDTLLMRCQKPTSLALMHMLWITHKCGTLSSFSVDNLNEGNFISNGAKLNELLIILTKDICMHKMVPFVI